jgi:hypothetical protein
VSGLVAAVLPQLLHQLRWNRQRPAPRPRLDVLKDPAAPSPLGALGRLVLSLGVAAAMVPTRSLELPPDPQLMLLEVDVVPHQPQRLALPQPQGQRDRPPRTVGQLGSSQQPTALLQRVRFELGLANTRDDRLGCTGWRPAIRARMSWACECAQ